MIDTTTSSFDVRAFRNALSLFPTGVSIITSQTTDGAPVGLTCNSFSSVSLAPPLVSWGLRKQSRALASFQEAGGFAINILSGTQQELSARFASSATANKFEGVRFSRGSNGFPLLDGCAATFECRTSAMHDAGDHVLFIGEVDSFSHQISQDPLVFCKGAYMLLSRALGDPEVRSPRRSAEIMEARRLIHSVLLQLACRNGESGDFDALERMLTEMEQNARSGALTDRIDSGVNFFRLIGRATHNEVVAALAEGLADVMRRDLGDGTGQPRLDELIPVRREIVRMLRSRNAHGADLQLATYLNLLEPGPEVRRRTHA